jgi:hypothetical protein
LKLDQQNERERDQRIGEPRVQPPQAVDDPRKSHMRTVPPPMPAARPSYGGASVLLTDDLPTRRIVLQAAIRSASMPTTDQRLKRILEIT